MSSEAALETRLLRPPTTALRDRGFNWVLWGGLALLLAISFGPVGIGKFPQLFANSERSAELLGGFTRPNFAEWRLYVAGTWETVQMALWGTTLAVIVAVPLGLMASANLSPWWLMRPVRFVLDVLRSVNELVVGLLFVAAVGLGPFAGVMALALHTTGVLGKLFSEAVEAVDPGPLEGVRATGASRIEEIVWGVLPQVAPLWTSFALYRFESNARSATVLGLIGAGGIGAILVESMNAFAFDQTSAIVIVIIVAVSAIDFLSQLIRKRLL
jgi:phosphonate transport system permease protein